MIALPLKRVRLETDGLLRERAFFSRAVRGDLHPLGYLDLIAQLAALGLAAGGERASALLLAAGRDVRALRELIHTPRLEPGPCLAVCLFQELLRSGRVPLEGELGLDVHLAVVGTSWCSDASERLAQRFPSATLLLERLGAQGTQSLWNVTQFLEVHRDRAQTVYALAELTRGALLGLATYLDTTWPAPSALVPVPNAAWPSRWA